jgi:hypothetical protein
MTRIAARMALVVAPALLLVACSGGSEEAASTASPSASASSSASPSASPTQSESAPPSPTGGEEEILVVLCDPATNESITAIESVLDPEFTLSQVVDVRTDDKGTHAILGFVQGPGLSVLAQWVGTGLQLEGLAAADEFAAQVTDVPQATLDEETQELLAQTVACYTQIHVPEDGDDKKKDDESAE